MGDPSASSITSRSVPSSFGRYEVVGHLATGGMAEILLARITGPSGFLRPVVIKRILPHLAKMPEFRSMFLDEARIVAKILHQNVVHVHELGVDGDELFLVMEYLEGESVGGIARRCAAREARFAAWLAAYVIAEACAGLHAAHELTDDQGRMLNLVHRDVTPQNVFVSYAGGVKLLDFGIAQVADRSVRTATGQVKGKFQYMSPEQCQGEKLDRRSDLFSVGAVLYELTTGTKPFKRTNELLTFKAICEEPIIRPSQVVENYPASLEPILLRALARNREDRYGTALEMRRDLLAAVRELEPEREARESLAQLMQAEFAERIAAKRLLIQRVQNGDAPPSLPAAEVDEHVELPAVTEMASAVRATAKETPRAKPARRAWLWAALAVTLTAIAAFVGYSKLRAGAPVAVETAPTIVQQPASSIPAPPAQSSASDAARPATSAEAPVVSKSHRAKPASVRPASPAPSAAATPKTPEVEVPAW